MKSSLTNLTKTFLVLAIVLVPVIAGAQWVAPTLTPPNGNTSAPVNLSNTAQTKVGGLIINTGGASTGLTVPFGNVGIGTLTPGTKLEVSGISRFDSGTPFSGINTGFASAHGYSNGNWGVRLGANNNVGIVQVAQNSTPYDLSLSPYGGNVGIGTVSPGAKLEVAGQVKITGGSPGAGKVLTSDATGLASWTTIGGGTIGGSGTTNYIPKFTAATTLGNSLITDNGSSVNVGGSVTVPSLLFYGVGGNSGQAAPSSDYRIYQAPGAWTHPYPDLNIAYHTGISIGAYYAYGGTRFFNNSDMATELFSVGNGDNNVRVANNLYVTGNVGVGTASPSQELSIAGDLALTGWIYTSPSGVGIYNSTNGRHFYSDSNAYWAMDSGNGMVLRNGHAGTPTGYLYWSGTAGSNSFGLLSPNGNWRVRVSNSDTELYGNVYAPIVYDTNNSGYYVDPSSTSVLNVLNISGGGTHDGLHYFRANKGAGSYVGGQVNYAIQAYSSDGGAAGMSFHRGGYYAVNMGLDPDNVFRIGGWSASSNRLQLDMSGNLTLAGSVYAPAFYYSSDKELKKNIEPLKGSLAKILKLEGVSFDWKESGESSIGVIAQDVEKVYPELVSTDEKTGLKSVEYGNLVAPLIEAIKEQQQQIDDLRMEIIELKSKR